MAEDDGQEYHINYRTGRSQPSSTQSSANSLHRSVQAQDLHGVDLERSESPFGRDTDQPRPETLPTLSEPHGELAITRQSNECAAAPDDTPIVGQVDAVESPTINSIRGSVTSVSSIRDAQEPQLNSDSVDLRSSTVSVGICGGTRGTHPVSRNASAPARCLFSRENGTTAGAASNSDSETPERMNPSTEGSGVEIDVTEDAAAATDTDVNSDASAPSMPKAAENDEEDATAGGNSTAAGPEPQAAANENTTERLAAAVAAAAAPHETLKDAQTGKNLLTGQPINFRQRELNVFQASGMQSSSTLQQQQQRQDQNERQDKPASDNRAPKLPPPTELSKPESTATAESVEAAEPQQQPSQDDEQQYQQQPERYQRQDERELNSTSDNDNLTPEPPQLSPEFVESPSTPATEFGELEPGQATSSVNYDTEPGQEQQNGNTHNTNLARPRRTWRQRLVAYLRDLFQPCAGQRPFGAA